MPRIVLDLETCSELELPEVGAHVYAEHPSTRITVFGFALDDGPVFTLAGGFAPGQAGFPEATFQDAVRRGATVVAHNFGFEHVVYHAKLVPLGWPPIPLSQWSCTLARCYVAGLPGALEAAAPAAGLTITKDALARGLMLRMARPRSISPIDGSPVWWDQVDPEKHKALADYCARDVEVERELDKVVPELPPFERAVFEADFWLNQRGLRVDQNLVAKMIALTQAEHIRVNRRLSETTDGLVTSGNQVARMTEWLAGRNTHMAQLTRAAVTNMLALPGLSDQVRTVLEARADISRASTAKLQAMRARTSADGRLRGAFQYYGANRTGRWAGRGVQPQNFFRGTIKDVPAAIDLINRGCDAEGLDVLFEDRPMGVIASCLRGTIQAAPGHVLVAVDLAQIEARVVAWLAEQTDLLRVFAAGGDVYTYTAERIGSTSRQLGKVLVLACGFGMGAERFRETAKGYGVQLSAAAAADAVKLWRETNAHIVGYWWKAYEIAGIVTAAPPGYYLAHGQVTYRRTDTALEIELPSGRKLIYREPKIERADGKSELTYMGGRTAAGGGMWARLRSWPGKLVENLVQAIARDVMAAAMVVMDERGVPLVATIHDELVAEVPADRGGQTLDWMLWAIRKRPSWAPDLPVGAAGWIGTRYKKG